MMMPGFSSFRIPAQVRLFVALSLSLALSPLLIGKVQASLADKTPAVILWLIYSESMTGVFIGFIGRLFFLALQTMLMVISMGIGISILPGAPIDDAEPMPSINAIIMMVATALVFIMDMQWELLRGLVASYSRIPPGEGVGAQFTLVQIADQISSSFLVALRIASPFIVYSVIVNLAAGITNKLIPQVPVYFIATPFVLMGGLFMFYFLSTEFLLQFMTEFAAWLSRG